MIDVTSQYPDVPDPISLSQVRLAATADLHVRGPETDLMAEHFGNLAQRADLLLVAGDLTENGRLIEAEAAAELLAEAKLPVVAVLGNHDNRTLRRTAFRKAFTRRGIEVLDGQSTRLVLPNHVSVGIAGTSGCGGGFWPHEGPNAIHARTLKRLAIRSKRECLALAAAMDRMDADFTIALTHFSPTTTTLGTEPLVKYWMLGNCELGFVLDRLAPDLAIHGHAHLGALLGHTRRGVPVRNVALPIVGDIHIESFVPEHRARINEMRRQALVSA
jgi:Icc-related predicted phosphoesterase